MNDLSKNFIVSKEETKAKAKVGKIGFLRPNDPKNLTNKAKKSFPTHK